jgi:phosphatidate phosphatase APP1
MQHFPDRKVILVGDSGERDPEVYREIEKRFSNQVQEIIIRDVINDKEKN